MSSPSSADANTSPQGFPASLAIHLDLIGGIAGDMFVAALVDALPALEAPVLRELAAMQPPHAPGAAFTDVSTGGLRARRFGAPGRAPAPPASLRSRIGAVGVHGTSYPVLRAELQSAPLSDGTRRHALALLALLANAEASVHGTALDQVHFHELADWDSRMDVVAAGCIAALLEGAHWSASSLPLGGGAVQTDHGTLPVPAPATTALLVGFAWHDDGVTGERVTPTGAAILRHLVDPARCGGARPAGRLLASGGGAGTRVLPGRPNLLRALVMERASAASGAALDDAITTIEFDIDDMTGEEIGLAAERLRAAAGALDVSIGTRLGKKGRPVADFRVLARCEAAQDIARACFRETTTLGLRVRDERRQVLVRDDVAATIGGTPLRVKVATRPDGVTTAKAEHDDVASAGDLQVRRATRAAAVEDALKGRKA
jgi:pyridinium-3,5-bisthiocarboxylic acid mononucleotide nickel chelatase